MKLRGTCEVAISKADMEYAMQLWLEKASLSEHRVVGVTLYPGNKYVARVTVEPPHSPKREPKAKESSFTNAVSK